MQINLITTERKLLTGLLLQHMQDRYDYADIVIKNENTKEWHALLQDIDLTKKILNKMDYKF